MLRSDHCDLPRLGFVVLRTSTRAVLSYIYPASTVLVIEDFLDQYTPSSYIKVNCNEKLRILKDLIERHTFFCYDAGIFLQEIVCAIHSIQSRNLLNAAFEKLCDACSDKEIAMWNIIHEWGMYLEQQGVVEDVVYYNDKLLWLSRNIEVFSGYTLIVNGKIPYDNVNVVLKALNPEAVYA